MENDQYEQLGPKSGLPPPPPPPDAPPPPINPPPPPPPPPPPNGEKHSKKIPVLPARTPGNIGQFALRPGDDVDLSSDRTGVNGSDEAKAKQSKSKDPTDVQSAEKEKGKSKTKHDASDLKPYSEPVENVENMSCDHSSTPGDQFYTDGINGGAICRHFRLVADVIWRSGMKSNFMHYLWNAIYISSYLLDI
ncbi:hypothetical protein V3C99_013039 [Haemonchus contortus]